MQQSMVIVEPKRAPVNYRTIGAKLSCMTLLNHADIKDAAYKMAEACCINDQDNESVEADQMDSTMWKVQNCSSPGYASVQRSEGESIRMDMKYLSVQSDEEKIEQESVEEMKQQVSNDEEKNTQLASRTRSARASKPSRCILP